MLTNLTHATTVFDVHRSRNSAENVLRIEILPLQTILHTRREEGNEPIAQWHRGTVRSSAADEAVLSNNPLKGVSSSPTATCLLYRRVSALDALEKREGVWFVFCISLCDGEDRS